MYPTIAGELRFALNGVVPICEYAVFLHVFTIANALSVEQFTGCLDQ